MMDDAGDAVSDMGKGLADGMRDVSNGVANGVNEMTGNGNSATK